MSMTSRWVGVLAGAALVLAGCQQPTATTPAASQVQPQVEAPARGHADNPELQTLIEGARQEGQLNIMIGTSYDPAYYIDGFNKTYGLNLTARYTPVPNARAAVFQV